MSKYLNRSVVNGVRSSVDFTNNWINIDNLCDVLVATQTESGGEVTFESRYDNNHDCHTCKSKCHNGSTKPVEDGKNPFIGLIEGGYDDDDDEDDFYLCEYCDALGYRQKYDSTRCDTCTMCESCAEFDNDECSGCSYSIYRDGTYYRERASDDELLEGDDAAIFKQLQDNDITIERFEPSRFSLLDH